MPTWMTSHGTRDKAASGCPAHFHSLLYQMGMSGADEAGSLILAFCYTGITITNRRTGDAFPGFWKPSPVTHRDVVSGAEWLLSNGILIWLEHQ